MEKNKKDEFKNLINWFPGHMAKAIKEIKEISTLADLFIVVLDARCPISSYNEDFDKIAPTKPRLFIITKSDIMDQNKKTLITSRFKNENLLWLDLRKSKSRNLILAKINKIMDAKIKRDKEKGMISSKLKSFVVGVPNSGKSTLINLMQQKSTLKVANYPGVTRLKQWVIVGNHYFLDTPGILLPKFENQEIATKLVTIGSIKSDIFPLDFISTQSFKLMSKYYPEIIKNQLGVEPSQDEKEIFSIFHDIAKNKGFYTTNNKVDLVKTRIFFMNWTKTITGVTFD
ncbi:ribosome biogenesis GTPase YlqF [Mycoplasmopsis alligatoris]|uniref:Ribosome biogenesis GTPase A n=1 Tax=Mycoplasmopsis alligatoris A21JP2 TaxID=747682 RepID=D4XWB4_9BACT|nr:ribosome biogenesis GTPase YlqF [Mycoplasmopsis alligatoris]EFF41151.1 ribosome biogenesis GTP-binding protein YlqF [Mycoplasmopsis alligatoris A21JP2]